MKKLNLLLARPSWILTCALTFCDGSMVHGSSLTLQMGEQKVVQNVGTPSITVSNPKVIKVMVTGKNLNIIARQAGTGEIALGSRGKKINVVVFNAKVGEARRLIFPWLRQVYGISLETRPDKILLHGTALRKKDWMDIQNFKDQFGGLLSSNVTPSPRVWNQIETAVKDELRRRSISSVKTNAREGQIELLSSPHDRDKDTTDQLAKKYGLREELSGNAVELRPMIEIEVVIAEMKKNFMRSLGLKPPEVYSATILPSPDLSSTAVTFNSMTPEFHASFSQNRGRVLANPKLLCRSGEVAHFVAGGEIPIKIISWKNSDVIWKRYGVILDITPVADLNEGISTKISTEISLLDEAHKVDGIPGFLTNRIDTHFDLRGTKTIVLSGLIKSEVGHNSAGIAALGEIPILGELFRSRDYQENKTELVIFVTPRMISPENPPPVSPDPLWNDDDERN